MPRVLKESPDTVIHRIETYLREAKFGNSRLIMNNEALVIEYNEFTTGHKRFEKISGIIKNNS